MTDAELLARLLRRQSPGPVEDAGATAIFEAISRSRIRAEVLSRGVEPLTAEQHDLLAAGRICTGHRRWCLLRTETGVPVADATALLLAPRVPEPARALLGMGPDGDPRGVPARVPLGKALRGLDVTREPLPGEVRLTPGHLDHSGEALAVRSAALLVRHGAPLGVVFERIYQLFLDTFPSPWPDVPQLAAQAAGGAA